jgi:folate-binding protein YgfZ
MFESEEFPGNFETDVCAFVDPRTSSNGVRILCAQESFQPEEGVQILTDLKQYNVSRLINGLCEGSSEIGNQFPLNMHLDALKGVSFSKGCYIGQELTQRTHFTGVIRKVALPFMLLSDQTQL